MLNYMETTITKTVKGSTMKAIFNNNLSVIYFEAIDLKDQKDWNPETRYKYKIVIRHAENTDANVLFEEARFKEENLSNK